MVTGPTYSREKGIKIHAPVTRRPGPVEPVWPAGSVGWVTERMGVYYVLCAFYFLAAGKAAVQEDTDGNLFIIVVFYSITNAKADEISPSTQIDVFDGAHADGADGLLRRCRAVQGDDRRRVEQRSACTRAFHVPLATD